MRGRVRVLPVVVFALTTFVFLAPALLGTRTYAGVDLLETGAPYRDAIGRPPHVESPIQTDEAGNLATVTEFYRELRHGELLLWDHRVAGGVPSGLLPFDGIYSPFSIGYLLLPAWYAVGLKVALILLFSQAATYLLLRRLDASVGVATLGGVAYAFCGTNIVLIHRVSAAAILPALLWAVHRLLERTDWPRVATVAALVAWTWLEGFPSGFVYCVYAAAGWAAWLAWRRAREEPDLGQRARRAFRRLMPVAVAMAIGVGLSLATLVPFLVELLGRHAIEHRAVQQLPPVQQFGFFEPRALGGYPTGPFWSGTNPVESGSYAGLAVAGAAIAAYLLAAAGRLRLRARMADAWPFFAGTAALVFVLCFRHVPVLYTVVAHLPGIANNPLNRTRFIANLALVVVAAGLLSGGSERVGRPSRLAAGGWIALVLGSLALATSDWAHGVWVANDGHELISAFELNVALAAAIVVLVHVARQRDQRWQVPMFAAASLILFFQLARPYWAFTPASPVQDFYSEQSGHRVLRALLDSTYRFAATGRDNFYPNSATALGLTDLRGQALYRPEFKTLIETAVPKAFRRDAIKLVGDRDEWNLASPALDHLAVGFFAMGTGEAPLALPYSPSPPFTWSTTRAGASVPIDAPGPIAAVDVPLEAGARCLRSRLDVVLRRNGDVLDRSSRPAFDARGQRVAFALLGGEIHRGDRILLSLMVQPACPLRVGTTGIDHQVAFDILRPDPAPAVQLASTEQAQIYRRPTAWPLVSIHTRWRSFPSQADALRFLETDAAHQRDLVPLVGDHGESDREGHARVARVNVDGSRVSFTTTSDGPAMAVVSENLDNHWHARVDGTATRLASVDGALAAVAVAGGTHKVVLDYKPTHFYVGIAGSLASALGLAVAGFVMRRRGITNPDRD